MTANLIDAIAVRRAFNRASATFDSAAVLHGEVRQRALDRLRVLRQSPETIVDLGAGTGAAAQWLRQQFPQARVLALDSATSMLRDARYRGTWRRLLGAHAIHRIAADAAALPLSTASIDWLFSNLMLPWCGDLAGVLGEWKRVLKPGGMLSFTTVGPDTFSELRHAKQACGMVAPTDVRFMDMHDLGDVLVRSGFAEPVIDVERFTLTYADFAALCRDLRATGTRNVLADRPRGLWGKHTRARLAQAYDALRHDDKLPLTVEVVYAQAWQPAATARARVSGETRVPIAQLRSRRGAP